MKIWQKYHYSGRLFRCFELKTLKYIQNNLMRPIAPPGKGGGGQSEPRWPLYRQYILLDQQETDLRTEKYNGSENHRRLHTPSIIQILSILNHSSGTGRLYLLCTDFFFPRGSQKNLFLQPSLLTVLVKGCSLLWANGSFDPHCISKALPRATRRNYQREV